MKYKISCNSAYTAAYKTSVFQRTLDFSAYSNSVESVTNQYLSIQRIQQCKDTFLEPLGLATPLNLDTKERLMNAGVGFFKGKIYNYFHTDKVEIFCWQFCVSDKVKIPMVAAGYKNN